MPDIASLNKQFGIPGVAEIIAGNGGLTAVRITSKEATGTVYLHGAHVATWQPAGHEEVLWLSSKSAWLHAKPIRGGVPLCFPWFGPYKENPQSPDHPAHGIARLREWTLESIQQSAAGVCVTLALKSDAATRAACRDDFLLRHRVTFGKELRMALELTNTGTSPMTAEEAQHTYFSVADVRKIRLQGLASTQFIDKIDSMKIKTQDGDIVISGETDRVYLHTAASVAIDDPGKKRNITIKKENSGATVVWNPWIAKARAMPDFGDEEWPGMMCVETCNVGDAAITLPPGQSHVMATTVAVAHS